MSTSPPTSLLSSDLHRRCEGAPCGPVMGDDGPVNEKIPDRWRTEVTMRVGYRTSGPWQLPPGQEVTFGRDPSAGLHTSDPQVSRHVARFVPTPRGWVVANGRRTRLRVVSPFVMDASFTPGAEVLLQPADWTLSWDYDTSVEIHLVYRSARHGTPHPVARDGAGRTADTGEQMIGTDLAGARLHLTALQRRRLGALFAYLIEGRPKPDQLIRTAADLTGDSVSQINGTWVKVRDYVNRHRAHPIEHLEDLGYHLVEVTGVLGPDDVPEFPG